MADEIPDANIIRLVRKPSGVWIAWIGESPMTGAGVEAISPISALTILAGVLNESSWPFDPTWQPRQHKDKSTHLKLYLDN